MSLSLILWKAPLVDDPEEAEALLEPWRKRGDDTAFEASDDIERCADELLRQFPGKPGDGSSPWAELPIRRSRRLLSLSLRRDAGDEVLDAVADLAWEHGLVLYDPQGPYLFPPEVAEPQAPPGPADWARFALFALGSVGMLALGQRLTVPVLDVVLTAFGGFLTAVVVFILVMFLIDRRRNR
jgi:hypothetical protein